ncbi:Sacsin [Lachnellula subtilissima]|uniref:Sacsin n=1 Tax=Lachnellula subtilissima TaxID=602034 RepID=A0A8H8RIL6_9HELO|nr:Sacsin [Lachnellula subtilissima]
MAPQPIGHNAQVQPITTTLRNICHDYPAGGTILRELLQNADDAGATEVRFILDEQTHPTDELLHPLLAQYQGPALLAYNNAQFSDKDFASLAHIGDSGKINDATTTGKFGRGFNSVYNWTDSPSIVSRDRILILDPHHEWSEGERKGGPIYNFVQDHEDLAIKNTMAAYQRVMGQFDRPLEGTIIRIPLRNPAQVLKSKISPRTTTVQEMTEILKTFADDFANHGLLFMRKVEKLELGSSGTSIVIEMIDGEAIRSHKSKVNDAVKCVLKDPNYSFDHSFQVCIKTESATESKQRAFIVHHCINGGLMDGSLRDWAATENLLPWVAVAAPLLTESTETINGSLFTVLPLPIESRQPVHIHGMFSLSPDRARLYHLSDRGTQDQHPAKWNCFLFKDLVPIAWTQVLNYLAVLHPDQPAFDIWPQNIDGTREHLSNSLEDVLSVIETESLPLWPSNVGYVSSKEGLLYTGIGDAALREALREAGAPVVYVPEQLQQEAQRLFKGRILGPESLCHFLRVVGDDVKLWSNGTKHRIAEYLLTEPGFNDYGGLELFPYMDGSHHSIDDGITFIHRDDFEKSLFKLQESQNLDLEKFSETAQLFLKQGCENLSIHPSICFHSANSLGAYCKSTIFRNLPQDQDALVLTQEAATFVSKVWTWISLRDIDVFDTKVSCLWLLPLSNGHHRKIKPGASAGQVYLAPAGESGDLMRKFDSESLKKPLPLLDTRPAGLVPKSVSLLLRNPNAKSALSIEDGSSLVSFLQWLHQTSPMLDGVTDRDRHLIAKLIVSDLCKVLTSAERETVFGVLRTLKIFQRVSWTLQKNKMESILTWINLNACKESFGLLDGVTPVPEIAGIQFIVAQESTSSHRLSQTLGLTCHNTVELIQNHVIPHWSSQKLIDWSPSSKEQLAGFIFRYFSCLSLATQKKLQALPIVPVAKLDGNETSDFACARELIDPSLLELTELCFYDEAIVPKKKFFDQFKVALKGCGLKIAVDKDVVQHRINCYAGSKYPFEEIRQRAHRLLKSEFTWTSSMNKQEYSELRHLKWLPTVDLNGTHSLRASNECRSPRDRRLANSQVPIIDISISKEWQERLGWENILSSQILMFQLKHGITEKDKSIVDAVLTYISQSKLTGQLMNDLKDFECVFDTNGSFILPSQAFCPSKQSISGYERLQPYLANVDRNFWKVHEELLLNIGVRDKLQLPDLLQIQTILESKPVLDDADLAVAIEVLSFACKFPRASLTGLKVVDKFRVFQPIHDINYNDLGLLKPKGKVNLTHEHIPMNVIVDLEIESLRARLVKGMLEIEDVDDEDEFDQRESVTSRISDTLDRYPVETTFREYLANADDVQGTSRVSWLLDPRSHACRNLLTPEMVIFQGPAFLVHNNGVFSDNDFKGFKNVGEGSKAQDKEKIGQFGRGSQTMYHWTDVPMILSGRFLLILDPRQEVLPKNQIKGKRKPGVKLELSKLREACGDQLAPFQDLWGYDRSQDNYPGTIFRFPLRAGKVKSILKPNSKDLNISEVRRLMSNYFDEARVSLLFLRRIKSIDFKIQGDPDSGWSVTRLAPVDEDAKSFSELVTCKFVKNGFPAVAGRDRWWVCIEDLLPEVDRLPKTCKRTMKNVECGLAALLSCKSDDAAIPMLPKPLEQRIFNTLPLPVSSDLPVHVHATFLLSGDRQSIEVDKHGAESHGAEWNRWLLQDACQNFILSQRRAAQLFDLNQAVFDFLPKESSEILAPFIMSLGVNLVRHVPAGVAKGLKGLPNKVNSITGSRLRQLLKSAGANACLLKEMNANPRTWEVLVDRLLPADADLEDLDGCHIIPLADGSLAPLQLVGSTDTQLSIYYLVSEEELELFNFAKKYLVPYKAGLKLERIARSQKFNLVTLGLRHVKRLLEMKPAVLSPNSDADSWLNTFWQWWNSRPKNDIVDHSAEIKNYDVGIFQASLNGTEIYATPIEFHTLPAIVEPCKEEHQKLCGSIPEIYRFNPKWMPTSMAMILQGLVIYHDAARNLGTESEDFQDIVAYLKSIPIWPTSHQSSKEEFISANDALIAAHTHLVVPWMKERHRFIDPKFAKVQKNKDCLARFEVVKLRFEPTLLEYALPLPQTLDEIPRGFFLNFIDTISSVPLSKQALLILSATKIGVNGDFKLRTPSELYDHSDPLFTSAFRNQNKSKFLHEDMQSNRLFCIKLGLRSRVDSLIQGEHYLECVRVLSLRLNVAGPTIDVHLQKDTQVVLALLAASDSSTRDFSTVHWAAISPLPVFMTFTNFGHEPLYRRGTMASVAAKKQLLCLPEVISYEHVAVCWSQTSFVIHEPTREVLRKVPGKGQPNIQMVWQHLLHLKSLSQHLPAYQLSDYLADLHRTYGELQNRLDESKASYDPNNCAVWLNLDSSDHRCILIGDLQSAWYEVKNLALNISYDSKNVKAVRPSLLPYEKLLGALGCNTIIRPITTLPDPGPYRSLAENLQDMMDKGELTDFTFCTEGQVIKVHRTVLAAKSKKFSAQFRFPGLREDNITYDKDADPHTFLSYHTLSTMISFAYEVKINWQEMQVLPTDNADTITKKLDLLLDLHQGADCWDIAALRFDVQELLLKGNNQFINLDNVIELRERAGRARAQLFENACAGFIEANRAAVERAHEGN